MMLIEIPLVLLVLVALVPVLVLATQVMMALPAYRPQEMPGGRRPAVAVVIPAHNEALMIADTLRAIVPQLIAGDRLLLVADNCTDETAQIAAAAGAEVLERANLELRGKGYALDFGMRHLKLNPPEIVLIIDADCAISGDAIERLSRVSLATHRPVQGLYLMHAPEGATLTTRLAEFAWLLKNQVRTLGFHRLGLPCQLMGSGMAFPWSIVSSAALASGHIVEDLKLGIELAQAKTPALFCPEARISSTFPATAEGISSQRTRWEHGHLGLILKAAPRLLLDALRHRDRNLLALALDLCVPPLTLLTLLVLMLFAVSATFYMLTASALPLWISSISLFFIVFFISLSWWCYGRQTISLADLASTPIYVLWKIPVYLKFLVRRQSEWVRSKRDKD